MRPCISLSASRSVVARALPRIRSRKSDTPRRMRFRLSIWPRVVEMVARARGCTSVGAAAIQAMMEGQRYSQGCKGLQESTSRTCPARRPTARWGPLKCPKTSLSKSDRRPSCNTVSHRSPSSWPPTPLHSTKRGKTAGVGQGRVVTCFRQGLLSARASLPRQASGSLRSGGCIVVCSGAGPRG